MQDGGKVRDLHIMARLSHALALPIRQDFQSPDSPENLAIISIAGPRCERSLQTIRQ